MTEHDSPLGIFLGCFVASLGANAYFIAPASIVPLLVTEFSISTSAAGLAISTAIVGTVLFQVPFGYLMDRYDNRSLFLVGTVIFIPLGVAGSVAPTYPVFLATRLTGGTAAVFLLLLGTNVTSQVFAGKRQGFLTTAFLASAPLGFATGQVTGPILATEFGWESVFVLYPSIALVGYLLFRLSRPSYIRSSGSMSMDEFTGALRNPSLIFVALSGFCSYSLYIFMNSWMPTYATERLALSLGIAGAVTALIPGIGAIARPMGGWVSDRVGHRRRLVVVGSLVVAAPAFLVITQVVEPAMFAVLMLGLGLALQFSHGVYYVFARELAAVGTGGTSLALFTSIAFTGTLVSPTVGGWLISVTTWEATFAVYAGVGVLGIVFAILARDSTPNNIQ